MEDNQLLRSTSDQEVAAAIEVDLRNRLAQPGLNQVRSHRQLLTLPTPKVVKLDRKPRLSRKEKIELFGAKAVDAEDERHFEKSMTERAHRPPRTP